MIKNFDIVKAINFYKPKIRHDFFLILTWGLFFLLSAQSAGSQDLQPVPSLKEQVTDNENLLSETERSALERKLTDFEQKKGSQIAILIIGTTLPETIEQYSIRVTDQWKLGRQNVDDGVLILVAVNDHTIRIEVGYGLEGAIPDAIAKRIIEQIMKPAFRAGKFYQGINQAVDALISLINGEPLPEARKYATTGQENYIIGPALIFIFPLYIIFLAIFNHYIRKKLGKLPGSAIVFLIILVTGWILFSFIVGLVFSMIISLFMLLPTGGGPTGGGYGGGYWGGGTGGYGGGGFGGGGFSGGGGGFGGGGASGGW